MVIYRCILTVSIIVFSIGNIKAANPGSNYGCEADFDHSVYTNWVQTFTASPNNPGWKFISQGYDQGGLVFSANYNPGEIPCGQTNPNNLQNAGQICWVYRSSDSTWQQGALRTWTPGAIVPCPIDSYTWILLPGVLILGCASLTKQKFLSQLSCLIA